MIVEDNGRNNRVFVKQNYEKVRMVINGNDNLIDIQEDTSIGGAEWFINGDRNQLLIGTGTRIGTLRLICQDGSTIRIGEQSTIEEAYILARDAREVVLGKDCMISFQVSIRTSDAHGIIDLDTQELINSPGDVLLEDHVWLAQGVIVSKNSKIGAGSVVGLRSFVQNTVIPRNAMAAGTPCKVLRERVRWTRSMDGT